MVSERTIGTPVKMRHRSRTTSVLSWLIKIVPFYTLLLLFGGLLLGSKGPIYIALLVSILIGLRSMGLRYGRKHYMPVSKKGLAKWGSLFIFHSHHIVESKQGREIRFAGKFFCARCYGLVVGVVISLVITAAYLGSLLDEKILVLLFVSSLFLIIPLYFSFRVSYKYGVLMRFISGFLAPILAWNLLIFIDFRYQSWVYNSLFLALTFVACNSVTIHRLYSSHIFRRLF